MKKLSNAALNASKEHRFAMTVLSVELFLVIAEKVPAIASYLF